MAQKKSIEEFEANAELLAAARAAYSAPFSNSFWEELTERLYPESAPSEAEVTPLPRVGNSRTV